MSTSAIGDLLKPSAPIISLLPNHCSNCARRCEDLGEDDLCSYCVRILETDMQLWECVGCQTLRIWGLSWPWEKSSKQLKCVGCCEISEHRYAYVTGRLTATSHPQLELAQAQAEMRLRQALKI